MEHENNQYNQEYNKPKKKGCRRIFKGCLVIFAIFFLIALFMLYKISNTINKVSAEENSFFHNILSLIPKSTSIINKIIPGKEINPFEEERINFLILGIRGADDPNGGLLTDTIIIASIERSTNRLALISIPRDIYTDIPEVTKKYKINDAYAIGEQSDQDNGGLVLATETIEKITGLNIHFTVSVNFEAFEKLIDTLGGITVYVPRDFRETSQWEGQEFFVPQGYQTMDGETALLYVRARYSTSDFDRARRQQDVLLAIKNKALNLGILANPLKLNKILDIVGDNVRMNMNIGELNQSIGIITDIKTDEIIRKVFDTTEAGLLTETHTEDGMYILQPAEGNFDKIKKACEDIFK